MRYRGVKLVIFAAAAVVLCAFCLTRDSSAVETGAAQRRAPAQARTARQVRRDYSKFNHDIAEHKAKSCDACHKFPTANWKDVRKGDDAIPDVTDYPEHASCLECHREQFFRGAPPAICTICHTSPGPSNKARHPFPNPSEIFDKSPKGQTAVSQFEVYFPHDKHEGMFGMAAARGARLRAVGFAHSSVPQAADSSECAKCHKLYQPQGDASDEYVTTPPKNLADDAFWLKKGTFMNMSAGHATCFTCHSQDGGMKPEPTDCSTCHKPSPATKLTAAQSDFDARLAATMGIKDKTTLEKWGRREASKFRHEWFSHAELKCADCHKTAALNTVDGKGATVAVLSCGGTGSGCHITPTSEEGGALNFEIDQRQAKASFQCTKCHVSQGKKPLPESHANALSAIKKK